jgi:hypothetical protein
MTLTSEELRTSWIWKNRWPTFLISLLVLILSGFAGSLVPPLSPTVYILLAVVDIASIFVLVRLAQLYHAPKRLKGEAMH